MPTGLRMKSKLNSSGSLDMYLDEVETGELKPHEVVVKVEAAPINPSDLGVMFGPADVDQDDIACNGGGMGLWRGQGGAIHILGDQTVEPVGVCGGNHRPGPQNTTPQQNTARQAHQSADART